MSDNLPVPFTTTLPVRLPERVTELGARFENISKMVDLSDKLLALESFRDDLCVFWSEAVRVREELQGKKPGLRAGMGICAAGVVIGGIVTFPSGLVVGLMIGGIVGAIGGGITQEVAQEKFEKESGDFAFYYKMERAALKMQRDIIENADPRVIVMSPQADLIFDKFKRLRQRFDLAKDIDKMRNDIAGKSNLPSIDKPRPEL